ncbi:hypothetical protein NMY22_g82 [Coprinellus aureogranulatus]|nr:hypothetical protein NMY22_g82 [Coprinellus aureogranulatus]
MATFQRKIAGHPTHIVLQSFADRVVVIVTQVGKVGNLLQVSLPSTTGLSTDPAEHTSEGEALPTPSPAIQLTPLLGSCPSDHHQTLQSLYASHIATMIWESSSQNQFEGRRRSVVVGLALRKAADSGMGCELSEDERVMFQGVMTMLRDILKGGQP